MPFVQDATERIRMPLKVWKLPPKNSVLVVLAIAIVATVLSTVLPPGNGCHTLFVH